MKITRKQSLYAVGVITVAITAATSYHIVGATFDTDNSPKLPAPTAVQITRSPEPTPEDVDASTDSAATNAKKQAQASSDVAGDVLDTQSDSAPIATPDVILPLNQTTAGTDPVASPDTGSTPPANPGVYTYTVGN